MTSFKPPTFNIWEILGIEASAAPTVTFHQVKRAFRQRILVVHPDKNPSPNAHEMTSQLNNAWSYLCPDGKTLDAHAHEAAVKQWAGPTQTPKPTGESHSRPTRPQPNPFERLHMRAAQQQLFWQDHAGRQKRAVQRYMELQALAWRADTERWNVLIENHNGILEDLVEVERRLFGPWGVSEWLREYGGAWEAAKQRWSIQAERQRHAWIDHDELQHRALNARLVQQALAWEVDTQRWIAQEESQRCDWYTLVNQQRRDWEADTERWSAQVEQERRVWTAHVDRERFQRGQEHQELEVLLLGHYVVGLTSLLGS